ncbi:hypothetical protein MKEN_00963500 [Mycena kentingensis (nom. inval.)]|nr:hypothetical protein MKEN_00963500 [Mycena kentingensis (nom. inval.)]
MHFITSVYVVCAMVLAVVAVPVPSDIEAREAGGGRGGGKSGKGLHMPGTTFAAVGGSEADSAVDALLPKPALALPKFNAKELRELHGAEGALIKEPSLAEPEFKAIDLREFSIDPAALPTANGRVLEANPEGPDGLAMLVPLLVLFRALLVTASANANEQVLSMTNAERLRRGLPPAPPRRLYEATRVRRDTPAEPSPTLCSTIGSANMPLEMHRVSDGGIAGYVGYGPSTGYINKIYTRVSAEGNDNKGLWFNVDPNTRSQSYKAITIAGLAPHAFCAEVNQYTQNLTYVDPAYASTGETKNYLYNVDCSQPGGYTQRANYAWNANGKIVLEWLQADGSEVFPNAWLNTNNNLFRWYAPSFAPTWTGKASNNPWVQVYIKWACT